MKLAGKTRIARHIEITWLDAQARPARCPNCGAEVTARQFLDIDYRPPDAVHHFILQICPACTVRFVDNTETMDYGTDELIEIGWHVYQVQLGAGVWPISAPLTRIGKPAGARVLEIGGAYGFGLDFCIRARGWRGEGYDPSPLASFGARELGLTITQDYFEAKDLARGPWDVVIATEVIEHLEHPPEFFALMRQALTDDGLLVLTTPDAERITPDLSAAAMMPLLSPGAHIVLQTAQSLRVALAQAGFAQVSVIREANSLIAYASPALFTLIDDPAAGRAMFRRYLVERAKLTTPESDARLGFAGRGLFEAANDGDAAAAEAAWAALVPAVRARFGLNLDDIDGLPAGAMTASLAELGRLMPLGLGMILFGRAMQLVAEKTGRERLLPLLRTAGLGVAALQSALAKRSLTDGLSANIGKIIETEILLCQAEAGDAACLPGLLAAADELTGWRGFIGFVNAGALEPAKALQAAMLPDSPSAALPAGLRRNALLSLANFALAPGGETAHALAHARALRDLGEDVDGILLQAFTRLVNAGDFGAAEALFATEPVFAALDHLSGQDAEDARIARIVLCLQQGRPDAAASTVRALARHGTAAKIWGKFLVEVFLRYVNDGAFAAAAELARGRAIEAQLSHCTKASQHDALAGLLLLDTQPGGTLARIPQRLEAMIEARLDESRLNTLALTGFVALVNAGEMSGARLLLHLVEPVLLKLRPPYGQAERNALFAAGILYLQERQDWRRSAATFARLRDSLVKHCPPGTTPDDLFWPGLRGEVLALHRLNRGAEATALLEAFIPAYPGAPDDLRAQLPAVTP